jgi:hypothetical protein
MAIGLWSDRQEALYELEQLGLIDQVYAALETSRPPRLNCCRLPRSA